MEVLKEGNKFGLDEIRKYILSKVKSEKYFPFDDVTEVYKVSGKMFALVSVDKNPPQINLKCDPLLSLSLRDEFEGIIPGYHMNKKHWNTIIVDSDVKEDKIKFLIDMSYDLVVKSLTKKEREELVNSV